MQGDADIASVASVMGHPARGAMLVALLSGGSLSATDLARVARIARSTASGHLSQLVGAGLLHVESRGRRRHHRLASEDVAHAVEALAALAPPRPVRSLRESSRAAAAKRWVARRPGGRAVALTPAGRTALQTRIGLDC